MKRLLFSFYLLVSLSLTAQDFSNLSFGTDTTLEVITWNIERFPKNGNTTINHVNTIIKALDADVIALQEISSVSSFNTLVNSLSGFSGHVDPDGRGLGYIYKTSTVQVNDIYEIYDTSQFWNFFPRSPLVMDFNYENERYIVINNHYKCCGDGDLDLNDNGDEETRRYFANVLLKEYIDDNFDDLNVFLVGDLNDSLTDIPSNNVFQIFFEDNANYLFTDFDIASGEDSNFSFPSWPSHLDHILITNELFDEFADENSEIEVIKLDEHITGGWDAYDFNITDHRPVALKLPIGSNLSTIGIKNSGSHFVNYPNPFNLETTFSFKSNLTPDTIEIYDLNGKRVQTLNIPQGKTTVTLTSKQFSNGIYFAKLMSNKNVVATHKIVVIK